MINTRKKLHVDFSKVKVLEKYKGGTCDALYVVENNNRELWLKKVNHWYVLDLSRTSKVAMTIELRDLLTDSSWTNSSDQEFHSIVSLIEDMRSLINPVV